MNILIVDDVKLIVEDLVAEVHEICPDAVIDGLTSALSAVELARHKVYDVALLDNAMPEMDGLTLAKQLIALNPSINIIFVTAYKEYALAAHEMYCSAFLVKPVPDIMTLLTLARILGTTVTDLLEKKE